MARQTVKGFEATSNRRKPSLKIVQYDMLDLKGSVKLTQRVKIAYSILDVIWVVLHLTLKEFFLTHCSNWRNGRFYQLHSLSTNHKSWLQHTPEFSSNALKRFVFRLVVFAATVSMP